MKTRCLFAAILLVSCLYQAQVFAISSSLENHYTSNSTNDRDVSLIRLHFSAGNGSSDECVLHFFDEATCDYDWMYDALKMESLVATAAECAFISTDNYALSIDSRPVPSIEQNIDIMADLPVVSNYTLTVTEVSFLPAGFCFKIVDTMSGEEIPVVVGEQITLSEEGPFNGNRFVLQMKKVATVNVIQPLCSADAVGTIEFELEAQNVSIGLWQNEELLEELNVEEGNFDDLTAGIYMLSYTLPEANCVVASTEVVIEIPQYSFVQLIEYLPATCNFMDDGIAVFEIGNTPEYNFSLSGLSGEIIMTGNSLSGNLILEGLGADIYDLEVDGVCGVMNTVFDLRDPLAAEANIAEENLTVLISPDIAGEIIVHATTDENTSYSWYLGEEWIGAGDAISYQFTTAGTHWLKLVADNGHCIAADSIQVSAELIAGLDSYSDKIPFSVLLSNDAITIRVTQSDSSPLAFSLCDILGRELWKSEVPQHEGMYIEASFNNLPDGHYILRCSKNERLMFSQKWMKR